jgi:hypothetical protein
MKLYGALLLPLLPVVLAYGEKCHYYDSDKYGVCILRIPLTSLETQLLRPGEGGS